MKFCEGVKATILPIIVLVLVNGVEFAHGSNVPKASGALPEIAINRGMLDQSPQDMKEAVGDVLRMVEVFNAFTASVASRTIDGLTSDVRVVDLEIDSVSARFKLPRDGKGALAADVSPENDMVQISDGVTRGAVIWGGKIRIVNAGIPDGTRTWLVFDEKGMLISRSVTKDSETIANFPAFKYPALPREIIMKGGKLPAVLGKAQVCFATIETLLALLKSMDASIVVKKDALGYLWGECKLGENESIKVEFRPDGSIAGIYHDFLDAKKKMMYGAQFSSPLYITVKEDNRLVYAIRVNLDGELISVWEKGQVQIFQEGPLQNSASTSEPTGFGTFK